MRTSSYKLKFKMREENPSLMNVFQKRNFKLLVDSVEQGISSFEKTEADKRVSATKSQLLEKRNHVSIARRHIISVNVFFQHQPKMILSFTA